MKVGQMLQHEKEITFVPGQERELSCVQGAVGGYSWERLRVTCREPGRWLKDPGVKPQLLHLRLRLTVLGKKPLPREVGPIILQAVLEWLNHYSNAFRAILCCVAQSKPIDLHWFRL